MKNEKTLNFSSKKEQVEGMNLEPEFMSRLAECLSNIKEKGIEGFEYTGRVTKEFVNQIAEIFKQDKPTMEQKIKKALLRYVPKDLIDSESASFLQILKCAIKEKPILSMIYEKYLHYLGVNVKICDLTQGQFEEIQQLVEAGSGAMGI